MSSRGKLKGLDILYKKTAIFFLDYDERESFIKVYCDMKWLPLHLRRQLHLSTYMFKIINEKSLLQFRDLFSYVSGGSRDCENCNLYTKKSRSHKQFYYLGTKFLNTLPQSLRHAESAKKNQAPIKQNF